VLAAETAFLQLCFGILSMSQAEPGSTTFHFLWLTDDSA